jgi:DNA repair protein RecN (Recombination protein N)
MLQSLYIKNYALIEEIQTDFGPGLTIITGETGAGKSILIDALSLLLGERASTEEIRTGAEKAIVEGVFAVENVKGVKKFLRDQNCDVSDQVIVRREISVKGQNRCFINDSPVSLSLLKELGDMMVDLHGQHDHQSLLHPETHIRFLDDVGQHSDLTQECAAAYRDLKNLLDALRELREKEDRLKEKRDLYEFQIREIDALNPKEGEESELEAELKLLENAEKLVELTSALSQLLYDGESSIHGSLVQARKHLETLHEIDPSFSDAVGESRSAEVIVEELAKTISDYNGKIEFNPGKLEEIRERLGHLALLKKKYGGSLSAVIAHRQKIGEEVALADNFDVEIKKLESAIEVQRKKCAAISEQLTTKRKQASGKIEKSVITALAELGIASSKFDVRIDVQKIDRDAMQKSYNGLYIMRGKDAIALSPAGVDLVEFYLSTNVGEDLKPLIKVASGGEVSRIMLALKSTLAKSDQIPVLIFDEIDVGVSGRIGQAVGMSLKKLSHTHQVIAITHLAQIAALADHHFAVEKTETGKRTSTKLQCLDDAQRVKEVAKLLSGAEITEAAMLGAKELMQLRMTN